MSKFFDDLYLNKLNRENRKLFNNISSAKEDIQKIKDSIEENIEYNDLELALLLKKARENPSIAFTKAEVNAVKKKLESLKNEAVTLINQLKNKKDEINDLATRSPHKYNHDISNNTALRRHANAVFGGNKNTITYEDYIMLLEMRKEIQYKEANDLISEFYK
jgi:predicted nuclease with TOPRIM domain